MERENFKEPSFPACNSLDREWSFYFAKNLFTVSIIPQGEKRACLILFYLLFVLFFPACNSLDREWSFYFAKNLFTVSIIPQGTLKSRINYKAIGVAKKLLQASYAPDLVSGMWSLPTLPPTSLFLRSTPIGLSTTIKKERSLLILRRATRASRK